MRWDDLNMGDKSRMIQLAVDSGITDLRTIRDVYNSYANGGPLEDEYVGPPAPYIPSDSIKNYIKGVESFRGNWYKDANGIDTVGYGFTGSKVKELYPNGMTKQQADNYFDNLVTKFARRMEELTPILTNLLRIKKTHCLGIFII